MRVAVRVLLVAVSLSVLPHANAATVTYNFTNTFSGTPPVASGQPFTELLFQDVAPGTVDVTVTNTGLVGTEFLSAMYFNISPNLNVTDLQFAVVSSSGSFGLPTIQTGEDAFKADGDGRYDVLWDFSTVNSQTFTANESVTYELTGIAGLTALDFEYLSTPAGGHGPFMAAGHIQSIGNGDSGWVNPGGALINVPEPATGALVAAGFGLLLVRRAARRRTQRG